MRPAVTVALLLAVVGSGCVAPHAGGSTTATPTTADATSPPATPTATTTTPTDARTPPTTATDAPPDVRPGNTLNYTALTDRGQAAFRASTEGEVSFVPQSPYVDADEGYPMDLAGRFRGHDFVRWEGRYYRLSFGSGDLYATYRLTASVGEPGPNETAVAFENVQPDLQDEVREAVTAGSYTAPFGKWDSLPPGLPRYVRYGNETYRFGFAVGDSWAVVMTAERVE